MLKSLDGYVVLYTTPVSSESDASTVRTADPRAVAPSSLRYTFIVSPAAIWVNHSLTAFVVFFCVLVWSWK